MPVRVSTAFALVALGLVVSQSAVAQFGGFGGFGGSSEDVALVERYDQDGDGRLNRAERDLARRPGTSTAGRTNFSRGSAAVSAGVALSTTEVEIYRDEPLYAPDVLRTLFIDFEYDDWESELEYFYSSDVEVPATITVDGKAYPEVGIHFRGNTSFRSVPAGQKRGLNVSFDFAHEDQRLLGYRTLNLLNGFGDPTFLRNVIYLRIANEYYPAPKANFVRVVINGEDWGVYVNVQQFNSDFTREAADSNEARWRIPGSFNSRGGLEYLGESEASYRREYDIRNRDRPESWQRLIELTRVLNQTPPAELVAALEPIFDIDGALRYLAVDNVLVNSDGYWSRNSDYSLFLDEEGRFHVTSYDANEALRDGMGGRRGSGSGGVRLSPLEGSRDGTKAMLYRMLMVPDLRERYLGYVSDIAETWLDWARLEPIVEDYRDLIRDVVAADGRKLYSTSEFESGVDGQGSTSSGGFGGPGGPPGQSLRAFVEQRRAYLLEWFTANAGAGIL
jgi:hypothetical protein